MTSGVRLAALLALLLSGGRVEAQSVSVRVRVISPDSAPVPGVVVRADTMQARTDSLGVARLLVPGDARRLVVTRLGFAPDSTDLTGESDVDLTMVLHPRETELSGVRVSATRSERRIEDDPVRVEALRSRLHR
jgi:hypothetical protein